METTWTLITIFLSLIVYIYWKCNEKHKYWSKKGVAQVNPIPIVGNSLNVFLLKSSIGELYKEAYDKFPNEKVVGMYELLQPILVIRDPKLIEKILVKDFQYFVDHIQMTEEENLFADGLFQLRGNRWRAVRYKLSPAFTSGKLKLMFNGMLECTEGMVNKIKENLYKDYEVKEALSNYTIDVIANIVFGIQMNDENIRNEFAKKGSEIFNVTLKKFANMMLISLLPRVAKIFGATMFDLETTKYFQKLIKNTFDQRSNGKYYRNDYVQHLLRLKEKGFIDIQSREEDDSFLDLDNKAPTESVEITDKLLYGQAFQFLTAGFEPLHNTLVFAMYDMARFPETQECARQQIKEVLEEHGGYTYQALKEMTYLEQCIQETLRIHPLTPFLFRECTKNYTTEDGVDIVKGLHVIIPIDAIHMDPKYFPEPDRYNPERLPPNNVRNNFTYMPFGDGPRMCIGLRFAIVELKLGLAKVLENFKFTLSPKTKVPFDINKQSFIPIPITKILFNITPA